MESLFAACQMYLIPTTILFTALGVAEKEGLKTGLSLLGIVTTAVWAAHLWWWTGKEPLSGINFGAPFALALIFFTVWFVALLVHAGVLPEKMTGYFEPKRRKALARRPRR